MRFQYPLAPSRTIRPFPPQGVEYEDPARDEAGEIELISEALWRLPGPGRLPLHNGSVLRRGRLRRGPRAMLVVLAVLFP